ncbi:hypothetical protein LTR91_000651 [Friedmanniomyces endolithicus]|uniref:UBC core domain-containing protein n=1 Tax=Friedmanniomyces endolithicus TaxID=329885 RepID=A0AAN6G0B0_9PEZI|nr:hypothetical protein LTR35_013152 [Friedmanniomyces endolithicus]KAK0298429.1 hypothetical protein LTS00_002809 [Friedmanniomyces endolithicus]KAK0316521.1 hypothetical protein LTR01_000269 [Friedmanniomyces endolithicus]KAK0327728.1 hypothetical protein LTR82_001245 [Friedmanniomyces endolithicus]KAK0929082.1 hypothetical protein LTR57_002157 [Friedmanniomyces endolithicus]
MERPLHVEDIVSKKSDHTVLALVERTHADVDTHEPNPKRHEQGPIKRHADVSPASFRKFLKDGVPPRGTVLVRWQTTDHLQLLPTSKLILLDRSLLIGDVVRKDARLAISGVVINTFTKCVLKPMGDITYKGYTMKGLVPPAPLGPDFRRSAVQPPVIRNVPASELMEAESPREEDLVIYKEWIGRVDAVSPNLILKLAGNCVVEVDEENCEQPTGDVEPFAVGDIAVTKKGHLRNGRWIFGRYDPNTLPVGTVVEIRPHLVEVTWLQQRLGGASTNEPPAVLERDELQSESFHIYDRTRRPTQTVTEPRATETVSNSEVDVRLGLRVRFKDLAGACVKYDGSTPNGKVTRIDRSANLGYDLNVFDIERFDTDITVQWQDLSITTEHSIDLIPDSSIEDEHAAWPGEIAHTVDHRDNYNASMPKVEDPKKVGVIQSVNAAERMAHIRWAPDAVIHYAVNDEKEGPIKLLLTGVVGIANGEVEEVSLYELEAPASLNVRRGDIVLVYSNPGRANEPATQLREWLGEVVDTRLDGTLTVRLGAAAEVRDVQLRREEVMAAIRSDGTDDIDGWDDGEDEEDDEAEEYEDDSEDGGFAAGVAHGIALRNRQIRFGDEIDGDGETEDGISDWRSEHDDDSMSDVSEEAQARYEDENGQTLDEEDVEDGDWESADEEMPDAPAQFTPPTSTSVTPPDTSKQNGDAANDDHPAEVPSTNEPPRYLILEDGVPRGHNFADSSPSSNPTHMKRVQKEHRILQKPAALPSGVYVRTWESRLDLLRVLFIGPAETPYAQAPFVMDFHLPPTFPAEPPLAFFYSWPGEAGLGGVGRVNPNLYEDGKICLSLLGTWEGSKTEGWNNHSTILQVVVSLLGLVLVKEPYFNEAGYETLAGLESSRRPSALYNERTFLRARTFIITALARVGKDGSARGRNLEGVGDVVRWEYYDDGGPRGLEKVIEDVEGVLERSEKGGEEVDGLTVMSKGACIPLRRVLVRLKELT